MVTLFAGVVKDVWATAKEEKGTCLPQAGFTDTQ